VDRIIHVSAQVRSPAATAFSLFVEPRLLEGWLAVAAEVDARPGGMYHLFWSPDRENDCTAGCRITAMDPPQLLSFEWKSPRQFKHFANQADPLTHVAVFFLPGADGTRVHLLHSGWRSSPEWEEARSWQQRAWEQAFRELEKYGGGTRSPHEP
jgi:uncharacterized protein YndB with AHSA1/START domain